MQKAVELLNNLKDISCLSYCLHGTVALECSLFVKIIAFFLKSYVQTCFFSRFIFKIRQLLLSGSGYQAILWIKEQTMYSLQQENLILFRKLRAVEQSQGHLMSKLLIVYIEQQHLNVVFDRIEALESYAYLKYFVKSLKQGILQIQTKSKQLLDNSCANLIFDREL